MVHNSHLNNFYKHELEQLVNSRSWRYTAPLRKIFSIFKKIDRVQNTLDIGALNKDKLVVLITHELTKTGAPMATVDFAKFLKSQNFNVFIISLRGGLLESNLKEVDIEYLILDGNLEILKNINLSNVLHVYFSSVETLILYDIFKLINVNLTIWLHELSPTIELYELTNIVKNLSKNETFIFGSNFQKIEIEKAFNINFKFSSIFHIYPKLQSSIKKYQLCENTSKEFKIVFAGTLMERKGADLMPLIIDSIQNKIQKLDLSIKYFWIGDIPNTSLYNQVKSDLKKLNLENLCYFSKSIDNLDDFLDESDILIVPSREDPAPLIAVNYLQLKKPVFSFKSVTGLNEYLGASKYLIEIDYLDIESMGNKISEKLLDLKLNFSQKSVKQKDTGVLQKTEFNFDELFQIIQPNISIKENFQYTTFVPVFNHVDYLQQRLESINVQTISPRYIYIVDDESRDGSVDYIRNFSWNETRDVEFEIKNKNSGSPFGNWDLFFDKLKTEFFWVAEGDDFASPNFIEKLSTHIDSTISIVFSDSRQVDKCSNLINISNKDHVSSLNNFKWKRNHSDRILNTAPGNFYERNLITNISSALLRKPHRRVNNLSKFQIAGDWLFYTQAYEDNARYFFLNEQLSYHRTTSESKRSSVDAIETTLPEINFVQKNILNRLNNEFDHVIILLTLLRTFIDTCLILGLKKNDLIVKKMNSLISLDELEVLNSFIFILNQSDLNLYNSEYLNFFKFLNDEFDINPLILIKGKDYKITSSKLITLESYRYYLANNEHEKLISEFFKKIHLGRIIINFEHKSNSFFDLLDNFEMNISEMKLYKGSRSISLFDKNIINFLKLK